ncbi:MAG: MBL fold metallo-hydrolase [Lachnospiraceae bacterium]|nr:MBL fold metallo-hydrolase [Lachnospiraceae bacterium]
MVTKLKYGNTNTYFVRGENGGVLIDTDYAGTLSAFYKELKKNQIAIADITYVLVTHYHPDHIGLVSELTKLGIKLLLLDTQYDYVHFADELFKREKHLSYEPIDEKSAVIITLMESREFLANMGIAGEIIPTASHSKDSISLILDNGECIVGDLEPMEYLDAYEENAALQSDWKIVMSYRPKVIYYAHANEKRFV